MFDAIAIIYNPKSSGPSQAKATELAKNLRRTLPKTPVELIRTQYAGHARELAYEIAKAHRKPLIVSSSGDGGYNEVINGALSAQRNGAKPICAVLPAGNANDHRHFISHQSLAKSIKKQSFKKIDVLQLTIRQPRKKTEILYAHSYAGIGFNTRVVNEVNKVSSNLFKELSILVKTMMSNKPVRVLVSKKVETYETVLFANIGRFGKVFRIKDAEPDDGLFELLIFEATSRPGFIKGLFRSSLSRFSFSEQRKSYSFKTLETMLIQVDGEVHSLKKNTSITVKSKHKLLRTLT